MNPKSKIAISIILVVMLVAATAMFAIVAVWAASQQDFSTSIMVKYKAVKVTTQASARWKIGDENWQDMTVGGEVGGATLLTFGEETDESSSLSPTDKNIELTIQNNFAVFEYKFTNKGVNDYAIDLFYTDDETEDVNMSVFCVSSDNEISSDFKKNINIAYVDWTTTKITGNGGTKYIYILASIADISKNASFSGSFEFNLDGKDYSEDLEFDDGTITGLKNDTLSVVRIPEEINGTPVIGISTGAFTDNATLTELIIPDSVEYIDQGALNENCSSLKYLSIPFVGGSRMDVVFSTLFSYIFGSYDDPDGQQSYIPTSLTNVIITDCTTIVDYAFYECTTLTSVTILNGVTSIGSWAFDSCSGLKSLTIPGSVERIGDYAFQSCTGLTSLTIEEGVTSIGNNAFSFCSGLTGNLIIPSTITSMGEQAFLECSGLTSLTIEEGVTSIGESAFSDCSGLTGNLIIPSSVESIGNGAFLGCTGLTSLTIEEGVTSIEEYAFSGCSGLTSIIIPSSVTSIGDYAFFDCNGLTGNLFIPSSVENIGDSAFSGVFTNIRVNSNNKYYTSKNSNGIECNCLIDSINHELMLGCNTSTIPDDGITSIGEYAFSGCSGLTGNLIIPSSVTSIGNYAFSGCSGLTGNLIIPSSVESIGNSAFSSCTGFTSLTIEEGVISIGGSAFSGCSGLTGNLIIPSSVTSIGNYAFSGCAKLTTVTIESEYAYTNATSVSACGSLLRYATNVRVLSGLVKSNHAYINNTNFSNVTTESVGDKEYTVYRK